MTAPSGREPARPQPGTDGTASTSSTAAQPRLSREAVVAFALLPVLLVAGFFLGSRLLGDTTDPGLTTAVGASSSPEAQADEPVVGPPAAPGDPAVQGPAVQGPGVESPAAAPTEEPAVQGPVGPPAPAEPTQPPAQEPAPAPPAQEPAPAPPAQEPAPAPPAQEPAPAPPAQEPAPAPPAQQPAPQNDTAVADAAPAPQAGDSVLLFPGFAGEDVRTWQARMVERGWALQVDGIYGPETASVAGRFQAQKGLAVDGLVGIETWNAAWTTAIT